MTRGWRRAMRGWRRTARGWQPTGPAAWFSPAAASFHTARRLLCYGMYWMSSVM
ncbi:MAG: hypothetical protein LBB98_08225 [Treponema sp.]|nr:hypothetical protein [Treponema sp.]